MILLQLTYIMMCDCAAESVKKQFCSQILDWTTAETEQLSGFHIVMATDCVYDTTIVGPLTNVLNMALEQNVDSYALVVSTIRNEETYSYFLKSIGMVLGSRVLVGIPY